MKRRAQAQSSKPSPLAIARPGGRATVLAAIATAFGVAAHLPALGRGFFSDDFPLVADNEKLASVPLLRPWRLFAEQASPWDYLPVRDLSYRLDLALFGRAPLGFQLVNLALFAATCAAAFMATRSVLRTLRGVSGDAFEDAAVVVATALFAVHPAHVESVAWISGRKDVLSGVFALACLWRFAEAISGERPRWRGLGAAALLFGLGGLSKASVLPLAPLLFLLAVARYSRDMSARPALLRAAAVSAPFALLALGTLAVASNYELAWFGRVEEDRFGSSYRPLGAGTLALRILGEFLWVALAPIRLHLHHDVRTAGAAGVARLAAGGAGVVAAVWGAWALVRRRSVVGFGVLALVAFTLPFLQLVPFRTSSEMCERWLYLPTFGLAVAVAGITARFLARRATMATALGAALVVAAGAGLTARRSLEWRSDERLAEAEVARAPGELGAVAFALSVWSPRLRFEEARGLAAEVEDAPSRERILLIADGWQAVTEGRRDDARRAVATLESLGSAPRFKIPEAYLALRAGEPFEALRGFEEAGLDGHPARIRELFRPRLQELERQIEAEGGGLGPLEALGDLQADLRMDDEAVASYQRALRLAPGRDETRYNLAMVLRRSGRLDEASAMFRAVADRLPDAWNDVAVCESALGRDGAAEQAFLRGVEANPRDWRLPFNLALLYEKLRRHAEARVMFTTARERAAASGLPVSAIDEQLRRLPP